MDITFAKPYIGIWRAEAQHCSDENDPDTSRQSNFMETTWLYYCPPPPANPYPCRCSFSIDGFLFRCLIVFRYLTAYVHLLKLINTEITYSWVEYYQLFIALEKYRNLVQS